MAFFFFQGGLASGTISFVVTSEICQVRIFYQYGVRSVVEDLHDSRFPVRAAVVFHRVGLLGRTMGFKKIVLIEKSFLIPIVLPSSPTLRIIRVPEWGWREAPRYEDPIMQVIL